MKRILNILLISTISTNLFAQNEGRVGVFVGVNQTSLANSKDKAFGDYLPTFKPTIGVEGGYHFTLFKMIPMGFSFQFSNSKAGQNYHGDYQDSTSYYAYTRLNYLRPGASFHFGSNPRRLVSVNFSIGSTIGILTNYQERYELIRYNNDRLYFDIKNNDVIWYDTVKTQGTLSSPMYNKTDLTVFGTMGFDVLLTRKLVFGVYGRYDMGMSQVENHNKMTINYNTEPSTSATFQPYHSVIKYRGPILTDIKREETKNVLFGVYLSLKYRLYNPEKIEFWYKEHKWEE